MHYVLRVQGHLDPSWLRFPSLARKGMSTNPPKLPNSPSEKSVALSENIPKSFGILEKVFDGFLGEKGLFW
jgi:hypothetical protein